MCFNFCILPFQYIRIFFEYLSKVLIRVWKWIIYADYLASLCSVAKSLTNSCCWFQGRTRFQNVKKSWGGRVVSKLK